MSNKDPQRRTENITRIVLRPLASPLPLRFFGFGMGSVLQSGLQFDLVPQEQVHNLALLFGAFVFPLELLATLLAFPSKETIVGASMLTIIAFPWLGTAIAPLTPRHRTRRAPP